MSFQFVIGPSGSGKTTYLLEKTVSEASENPRTQYIYVVPDQFTMEMQKAMVLKSPGHAIMNIDVLSFGRMCHRIFEETGSADEAVLNDTGKNLILQRLAVEHQSELSCLGRHAGSPAMIHEIKSTISEFMQYSVGENEIDMLIESARENRRESLALKLADIKLLYGLFLKEIDGAYTTTEGRMGLLAGVIPESEILRDAVLVFDGFTGFTPVQCKVLTELMKAASSSTFSILARDDKPEGAYSPYDLFALSYRTMATIRRCAAAAGEKEISPVILSESRRFDANPSLGHVEKNLFGNGCEPVACEGLSISVTANPAEEIAYVGRKISALVRKENYAYRDIAVICSDMETYGSGLERELTKRGIPCFVDTSLGIIHDPCLEFIRGAIAAVETDFTYGSIMTMLRSGMGPLDSEESDFMEYFIAQYGIRGRSRWKREYFGRKLNERNMADLERAEANRLTILECIGTLTSRKHSPASFCGKIREIIEINNLAERTERLAAEIEEDGDPQRASEIGKIMENIEEVLSVIEALCSTEPVELSMFRKLFDSAFSEISVGTVPRQVDRILVGDIERTRLSQVKVLFFVGLNDGLVPRKTGTGGVLSDLEREVLVENCHDIELAPTPRELVYRQRLYLYMNVTKPTERLYMSYSGADVSGRQMTPSYFVGVIQKMFSELPVRAEKNEPDGYMQLSDGLSLLASGLRDYAKGFDPGEGDKRSRIIAALYSLCARDEKYAPLLSKLESAAFYNTFHDNLDEAVARALYGNELSGSVSKFETYARCPYLFFLNYGIVLRQERSGEVDVIDIGNLTHDILEKFGNYVTKEGLEWAELDDEDLEEILELALRDSFEDPVFERFDVSGKTMYRRDYVGRIAATSVRTLRKQLAVGNFKPAAFEKEFRENFDLSLQLELAEESDENSEPARIELFNGCSLRLNGKIDRIDTVEIDGKPYIKIIDYKTGSKSLEYSKVAAGAQIQLPIYLGQAMKLYPEGAEPAAMFYYRAQNPLVKVEKNEEKSIDEMISGELAPLGLANNDPAVIAALAANAEDEKQVVPKDRIDAEQMREICEYSLELCKQMAREILFGNIQDYPLADKENKSECEYCGFGNYCRFGTAETRLARTSPVKDNNINALLEYIWNLKEDPAKEDESTEEGEEE